MMHINLAKKVRLLFFCLKTYILRPNVLKSCRNRIIRVLFTLCRSIDLGESLEKVSKFYESFRKGGAKGSGRLKKSKTKL